MISGRATYLMWLDVSKITKDSNELYQFIRQDTGLIMSSGTVYRGNGHDFLRINLACPKSMVEDAMSRLEKAIKDFKLKNK